MKGTLFSADFATDSSDNLRLLEINTDTGIPSAAFTYFDYSPLYPVWDSNTITEIHVIYKDFQSDFLNHFSSSIAADYTGSALTFHKVIEEGTTIYPTTVADADDRFILRLAYDEAAILDSTYAKNNLNILELFTDNDNTASAASYYYSSSDGTVDTLDRTFNSNNMPDIVVKDTSTTMYQPLKFYKIGHSASGSEDRYTNFIEDIKDGDTLIQNYYENLSGNKATSTRVYSVVYGTALSQIILASTETEAVLEKPTSTDATDSQLAHQYGNEHYFEFATNTPVFGVGTDYGGIFEEEELVKADGSIVAVSGAAVSDTFKSYFISGSPDSDVATEYLDWEYAGTDLPSGSYITSSVLINNVELPLPYGIIFNLTPSGSGAIRISGASAILVHDSGSNKLKYETLVDVDPAIHSLINISGSLVPIASNEAEVLSGSYKVHVIDMETTDTFFLADENTHLKIVTHNCFPAGTTITLSNGDTKSIEDVVSGDELLSWNEKTGEAEPATVGSVKSSQVSKVIKLTLEGEDIISTPLHRLYVAGKGWTVAQDVTKGDKLVSKENNEVEVKGVEVEEGEVTVYRLDDVADNYNFYANGYLVHNWKCFTYESQVEMFDGTTKPIGEVVEGDKVKSFINGEFVQGTVTKALVHPTEAVVDVIKTENMIGEPSHPVLIDNKWTTLDKVGEVEQMYITNWYNLEVDGDKLFESQHNFIVDGHIVSGLGDNDSLNEVFNRQELKVNNKLV